MMIKKIFSSLFTLLFAIILSLAAVVAGIGVLVISLVIWLATSFWKAAVYLKFIIAGHLLAPQPRQ